MEIIKNLSLVSLIVLLSACAENEETCSANVSFTQTTSDNRSLIYTCYRVDTTFGDIDIAINKDKAPLHADNFAYYADNRYYDGTIFHRVIRNFMIQGGGFTLDMKSISLIGTVKSEADNGLSNVRCTLAAARLADADSAQAQFYINVVDNRASLDYSSAVNNRPGYTVFGHVINGMSIVDDIRAVPTGAKGDFTKDVPRIDAIINSIRPKDCETLF